MKIAVFKSGFSSYSIFSSNKVRLIHDEKADVLDVLPLLPATRQNVPFVGGTDNNVPLSQQLQICARLSCEQHHLLVQDVLELLVPVDKHLREKEYNTYSDYVKSFSLS